MEDLQSKIIPAITGRLSAKYPSQKERSEEVREKCLQIVISTIDRAKSEADIKPIGAELLYALLDFLKGTNPSLNLSACDGMIALSHKIPMPRVAQMVVEAAMPLLGHRRSPVKIAGLRLMATLIWPGKHEIAAIKVAQETECSPPRGQATMPTK